MPIGRRAPVTRFSGRFESDSVNYTQTKCERLTLDLLRLLSALDEETTDCRYADCRATARTLYKQLAFIRDAPPRTWEKPSSEPRHQLTEHDRFLLSQADR